MNVPNERNGSCLTGSKNRSKDQMETSNQCSKVVHHSSRTRKEMFHGNLFNVLMCSRVHVFMFMTVFMFMCCFPYVHVFMFMRLCVQVLMFV